MTRFILAAVAVLGLSELAPAQAQFFAGPISPYGSYSYSYRGGLGFSLVGRRFRASGFSGGFGAFGPVGFGSPFWGGWGPGFGTYGSFGGFAPIVITVGVPVPVPVPVGIGGNFPDPNEQKAGENVPPRDNRLVFPKGAKEDDFFVIVPKKNAPGIAQAEPIPLPLPLPKPPLPRINPFGPPAPVKAEVVEADPKKEAARLVNLGRMSFAAGDYGRAAENFERAIATDAADAKTYFFLAQAKFAAGQFAEAVKQIRKGLALDPKWPASAFDPLTLYGDHPERFVLHLLALKKANTENPNNATLEFLLGYELWFSGDKPEANKLFRAAENRLPAPGPIGLFKLP